MENIEIDANVVTTLGMAQSCAVWLMTIFPQRVNRELVEKFMEQFGYGHSSAQSAIDHVIKRRLVECSRRGMWGNEYDLTLAARFNPIGLDDLRALAVEKGWFPTRRQISSTLSASESYRYYGREGERVAQERRLVASEATIAAILGCDGGKVKAIDAYMANAVVEAAFSHCRRLPSAAPVFSSKCPVEKDWTIVLGAAVGAYLSGRDVRPLLPVMNEALRGFASGRIAFADRLAFASLCACCGRDDLVRDIDAGISQRTVGEKRMIERGILAFKQGDWPTAATELTRASQVLNDSEWSECLLPLSLLLLTAINRADGKKTRMNGMRKTIEELLPKSEIVKYGYSSSDRIARNAAAEWGDGCAYAYGHYPFGATLKPATAVQIERYAKDYTGYGCVPFLEAIFAPGMKLSDFGAARRKYLTEELAPLARKLLADGNVLLAGFAIAAHSRFGVRDEAYETILKAYEETGWALPHPLYDADSDWRDLVTQLVKIVGGEGTDAKAGKGRGKRFREPGTIGWLLGIEDCNESVGGRRIVKCASAEPWYLSPQAKDRNVCGATLTVKRLFGGTFDDELTESDRMIGREVSKAETYSSWTRPPLSFEALRSMIGHPHLFAETKKDFYYHSRLDPNISSPVSVVKSPWTVTMKPLKDGGLKVSVPKYLALGFGGPVLLAGKDGGVLEILELDVEQRKFLTKYFKLVEDGELHLPKPALEAARPVIAAIARIAPVEGNFGALGEGADLPRVEGNATPVVRLAVEAETLGVTVVVKPYAKNAALVMRPGVGSAERMVKDGNATVVLVRDLVREKENAAAVDAALADFEGWRTDEGWSVEGLEEMLCALDALKSLGEAVSLEWSGDDRLGVTYPTPRGATLKSDGGADRWFRVDGEFTLDDGNVLSLMKLLAGYRSRIGRFVPLGERSYLRLSQSLQRRLEALEAAAHEKGGKIRINSAALPMLEHAFRGEEGELELPERMRKTAEEIRRSLKSKPMPPERLKAVLRPYQDEGYRWLAQLVGCGFGCCLADDMGLGKTVQLIALLLVRAKDGPSLVIAPTSVCGNWRRELERFAPTLRPRAAWAESDDAWRDAGAGDIVLASYGLLVSREQKFAAKEWNGVVLDEAQAIKNELSQRAKAARRLVARFRITATGTPVENRLTELWSIMDFANPGLLGSSREFVEKYVVDGRARPALKKLVSPLILRRLKREVLDDLPDKTEITLTVPLEGVEREGYEACRREALETLQEGGGEENRISILAELTRLRRYCCHPSLVMPKIAESAKMEALVELLRELRGGQHRALVFSQFTDYLALVEARLQAEGMTFQYLDGTTPVKERERRVDAFQRGEGDVFLMSLKAGGTGINLTAANYVILLDPWWNPAVEDQAADRAHRIGQKNPVTVYRLIAEDTVEERVLELHKEKKAMAEDVLEGAGSSALTPEALMRLFR